MHVKYNDFMPKDNKSFIAYYQPECYNREIKLSSLFVTFFRRFNGRHIQLQSAVCYLVKDLSSFFTFSDDLFHG